MQRERRAKGISLAETTVKKIQREMDHYGVAGKLISLGTETDEPVWRY